MRSMFSLLLGAALMAVVGTGSAEKKAATPLGAWMKQTLAAQRGDYPGLTKNLTKLVTWVPDPAWTEWSAIAKKGVDAATAGDADAVRATCKACHSKYKDEYISRFPTKPPPP